MINKPNRKPKGLSTNQRCFTPIMLIESPKLALQNYKLTLKKSKDKQKVPLNHYNSNISPKIGLISTIESIESYDTCMFENSLKPESNEIEELKTRLIDLQHYTEAALETQQKYFEKIIEDLKQKMRNDRQKFTREISMIREGIMRIKEEKSDSSTICPDKSSNFDYHTQFYKNQEFIMSLEQQNARICARIGREP